MNDNGTDNQTPVAGNIVKEITFSDHYGSFDGAAGMAFSTDSQGRTIDIATIALTGEKVSASSYTYDNGIVIVNRITGPARGPITYTMANGRVTEDQYRCEKWTYNADGTLAGYKADFTGSEFENNFEDTEVTYRWSDGNITSCDIKKSTDYYENVTKVSFKYTGIENTISNIDINMEMLHYLNAIFYLPYTYLDIINLMGASCRNLLESASITHNDTTENISFTYETDDSGRITEATATMESGPVMTFGLEYL